MSDWAPRVGFEDRPDLGRQLAAAAVFIDVEDRLSPRQPTLLHRYAHLLQLSGAAVLGCLAAAISMLAVFIVFTVIFHFQPT